MPILIDMDFMQEDYDLPVGGLRIASLHIHIKCGNCQEVICARLTQLEYEALVGAEGFYACGRCVRLSADSIQYSDELPKDRRYIMRNLPDDAISRIKARI